MKIPENVPWKRTCKTLGSGGQGTVYLVTHKDKSEGPVYALKELRNRGSDQARQRFQREIEAVRQLDHPNIIRIFDNSEPDDEFQYYVMEYHEDAKTLASIISSSTCNPFHGDVLQCLDLLEQLVTAIGECAASKPPIVHRDINPKNILILPDHTIRLIDFGICQVEDGQMITLVDEGVGARYYASPECEEGLDSDIGTHSDTYSAAKVLWSAITSQQAFPREAPVFGVKSMSVLFPNQPETWHLIRIFEKTIRQRPEDRFQGFRRVLTEIRELRYLIQGGYPPLEDIRYRCPSCGRKCLTDYLEASRVYLQSRSIKKASALMCEYCGFAFLRNSEILHKNIEDRSKLS